jgi:hypothetical protein
MRFAGPTDSVLAFFTETPKMNIDNGKPLFQLSENG